MYYKMLFVATCMMLDTHPWLQLMSLCILTLAILIFVLVDKPYRCPNGTNPGRTYRFYTGRPVLPFGWGLSKSYKC